MYNDHPLVAEVIVINNASAPLPLAGRKIRVLDQEQNLYVNRSWNVGAREAASDYLIISNDDISFHPRVIDAAARALRWPVGIIGPDPAAFARLDSSPWFLPAYDRTRGFGTLMFLRARDYVPVPGDLMIWCGDDYLFNSQRRRNLYLKGARIDTAMSTTSGDPAFDSIKQQDLDHFRTRHQGGGYGKVVAIEAYLWRHLTNAKDQLMQRRG